MSAIDRAVSAAAAAAGGLGPPSQGTGSPEDLYQVICLAAQEARSLAEQSFSNPAVLAQLSYPPSHLVGVYLPLFLPVGITLLGAIIREVKGHYKRRKGSRMEAKVVEKDEKA